MVLLVANAMKEALDVAEIIVAVVVIIVVAIDAVARVARVETSVAVAMREEAAEEVEKAVVEGVMVAEGAMVVAVEEAATTTAEEIDKIDVVETQNQFCVKL